MEITNVLKEANYTLLLPRTDVRPLDLIELVDQSFIQRITFQPKEGELMNASIKDLFKLKGRGRSTIKTGTREMPTTLKGTGTLETQSSFVLRFLEIANVEIKLFKQEKVAFNFQESTEAYANRAQLEDFMNAAELKNEFTYFDRIKNGKVYIITSLLQSPILKIHTINESNNKGSSKVKDPSTQVEEDTDVSNKKRESCQIIGEGNNPYVFAIKAAQLQYKNGTYSTKTTTINVRGTEDDQGYLFLDFDEVELK